MVIREEEATRIARDLHDEVGQSLTSILLGVQALRSADDPAEMRRHADVLRALTARSLDEIRRVIRSLRPPALDEVGLLTVLRRHLSEYGAATGLRIDAAAARPRACASAPRRLHHAVPHCPGGDHQRRQARAGAMCQRDPDPAGAAPGAARRGRRLRVRRGGSAAVAQADGPIGPGGDGGARGTPGGTVRVESAPGRGATGAGKRFRWSQGDRNMASIRVLVADDHPIVRYWIAHRSERSSRYGGGGRGR